MGYNLPPTGLESDILLVPINAIYNIPLSLGSGNKVYDVNSDTEYTIAGTVNAASWVLQDEYHYNVLNGFTKTLGIKYPASQLVSGKDVLGGTLTNPSITDANSNIIGHNGAETKLQQPDIAALKTADINNYWFTALGVANKISFADILNDGLNIYTNIVDATNNKRTHLLYSADKTLAERIKIDNCFLCHNTLPDGYEWLTDSNGEYITDSNGEYIYE
jgi:hypothetical protein